MTGAKQNKQILLKLELVHLLFFSPLESSKQICFVYSNTLKFKVASISYSRWSVLAFHFTLTDSNCFSERRLGSMQISHCLCVGRSQKASLRKVFSPVWERMHAQSPHSMLKWFMCLWCVCEGNPSLSVRSFSQPSTLGLTPVCQLVSSVCSAFPYCLCLPQPTNVLTSPVA